MLEECSDDDSSNSEPTMDNQTRMVRKLSNNGKQLMEKVLKICIHVCINSTHSRIKIAIGILC